MRTTLKAQAIRLIAVFLLITASTTTVKAQISQHPELYKALIPQHFSLTIFISS